MGYVFVFRRKLKSFAGKTENCMTAFLSNCFTFVLGSTSWVQLSQLFKKLDTCK